MNDGDGSSDLNQAERYGGPASNGGASGMKDAGSPRKGAPSVASAYVGGVAMVAATLLAGLMGASALLAFFLGFAVFVGVVMWMRPGAALGGGSLSSGGPIVVDRAAAVAAGLDPDRAEARLREAAGRLSRIDVAASMLGDPALSRRLRAMTSAARETLRLLAEEPGDIDRARKFLVVTIPSAEAAVEKYQGLGVRDAELAERFGALMDEVAEAARRQREALRRDDALALEVEMEVLGERLRQN